MQLVLQSCSEEISFLVIPKSLTNREMFDGIRNEHDTMTKILEFTRDAGIVH
jgi:hypothetical protein